ncbi:hypothetical protein DYB28_010205 [Aphanomyces astaci]|uniref:DDE-1 domain-containing protein n=1 Tax=Aphanomyces astaci TaxID=112090 RepID=A0A9X8DRN2_APHAT|nr:hypothetical protein DYB28_010205 [Aphanomyces astaci]
MDGRVWAQYLREVLGESIEEPSVVLMDNYECHVSVASYKIMYEELGTHLCPLPANSTSVCQPLDVGVMAPFKRNLRNLCLLEEQIIGDDEDLYSLTAQQKRMAMVQRAISARVKSTLGIDLFKLNVPSHDSHNILFLPYQM